MTPNLRSIPREDYEHNKTYPILVKIQNAGYHKIVEMEGWKVNEHNRMVREQNGRTFDKERFTKLIVQECLLKVNGAKIRGESMDELITRIKEDFGVE